MQYDGSTTGANVKLTLTTQYAMDIYIGLGKDSDPNRFQYDWKFTNTTDDFVLESRYFTVLGGAEGFAVAVYVEAYNAKLNEIYDNTFTYQFESSADSSQDNMFTQ